MAEELTAVPMDAHDRERLALLLRGEPDMLFVQELIVRYDVARSFKTAVPERLAFMCDPDESGGYDMSDPKSPGWHSRRADLYDLRDKTRG